MKNLHEVVGRSKYNELDVFKTDYTDLENWSFSLWLNIVEMAFTIVILEGIGDEERF